MFEHSYIEVPLPSKGKFYENGCNVVKVYYMTAADEQILENQQLIQNNRVIDELLRNKVVPVNENTPFVDPQKMLFGDRLTVLIALRCTMENMYRFKTIHPITNKEVIVETDLAQLESKPFISPDSQNLYDFTLPKCGLQVKFKLLTNDVDELIKKEIIGYESKYKLVKLQHLIKEIDGETDTFKIKDAISRMPLSDSRALNKYIDEVTPCLDLNVKCKVMGGANDGETITTFLSIQPSFFYPELI